MSDIQHQEEEEDVMENEGEDNIEQDPPIDEEEEEEEEEDDDGAPAVNIKLQNVVATVNFGCPLDLSKIANSVRNAEYNPSRFHAVIMRIRDPRTTALLFKSGKMIVTGAKNEKDNLNGARKYTAILQKLGIPAVFNDFKVQNITATFDCGFPIRLESFLYDTSNHNFSTYEPELFPGLIYRMVEPKAVLLIFVSGKVVLTGVKTNELILEAVNEIFPRLTRHRKTKTVVSTAS